MWCIIAPVYRFSFGAPPPIIQLAVPVRLSEWRAGGKIGQGNTIGRVYREIA